MNRRQIVVMWLGIAAAIAAVFLLPVRYTETGRDWTELILGLFMVVLLTTGGFFTFRDRRKG